MYTKSRTGYDFDPGVEIVDMTESQSFLGLESLGVPVRGQPMLPPGARMPDVVGPVSPLGSVPGVMMMPDGDIRFPDGTMQLGAEMAPVGPVVPLSSHDGRTDVTREYVLGPVAPLGAGMMPIEPIAPMGVMPRMLISRNVGGPLVQARQYLGFAGDSTAPKEWWRSPWPWVGASLVLVGGLTIWAAKRAAMRKE